MQRVTAIAVVTAPDPRDPDRERRDVLTTAVIDGRLYGRWDHDGVWFELELPPAPPASKPKRRRRL